MAEIHRATRADNRQLLALTRSTPMAGAIGLRIDREPDFFRLLSLRGPGTVLVRREDGEIQGCITVSSRLVWAAGARRPLWYVGDMKVRPEDRKTGVGAALAGAALNHLLESGADLVACVVAQGNRRALTFLEGRFQIPDGERRFIEQASRDIVELGPIEVPDSFDSLDGLTHDSQEIMRFLDGVYSQLRNGVSGRLMESVEPVGGVGKMCWKWCLSGYD
ncbi:MAG: GNAT family N-acetyltransferase, partial [Longimicrobiales bacterium]